MNTQVVCVCVCTRCWVLYNNKIYCRVVMAWCSGKAGLFSFLLAAGLDKRYWLNSSLLFKAYGNGWPAATNTSPPYRRHRHVPQRSLNLIGPSTCPPTHQSAQALLYIYLSWPAERDKTKTNKKSTMTAQCPYSRTGRVPMIYRV